MQRAIIHLMKRVNHQTNPLRLYPVATPTATPLLRRNVDSRRDTDSREVNTAPASEWYSRSSSPYLTRRRETASIAGAASGGSRNAAGLGCGTRLWPRRWAPGPRLAWRLEEFGRSDASRTARTARCCSTSSCAIASSTASSLACAKARSLSDRRGWPMARSYSSRAGSG